MHTPFEIIDLDPNNPDITTQVARLMVSAFQDLTPSWPDEASGLEEIDNVLGEGGFGRVALAPGGKVLGWIGGMPQYDGHVWELHPLAVAPQAQGQGVGSALVVDFEEQVRQRGGGTIFLGTDDENGRTSLFGIDLYPDLLNQVAHIQNTGGHPFGFYQKMGFVVVGILPDANGFGKPDIFMAKRVAR